MFLMPARAVTQNYKMTLKNQRFKGSFLFWRGGSHYFNLTGSKILARVGQISVTFPVTELLLKSALSCLLQIEQFYANHFISCSLSVSLHKLRFFFIFKDQLRCDTLSFPFVSIFFGCLIRIFSQSEAYSVIVCSVLNKLTPSQSQRSRNLCLSTMNQRKYCYYISM